MAESFTEPLQDLRQRAKSQYEALEQQLVQNQQALAALKARVQTPGTAATTAATNVHVGDLESVLQVRKADLADLENASSRYANFVAQHDKVVDDLQRRVNELTQQIEAHRLDGQPAPVVAPVAPAPAVPSVRVPSVDRVYFSAKPGEDPEEFVTAFKSFIDFYSIQNIHKEVLVHLRGAARS